MKCLLNMRCVLSCDLLLIIPLVMTATLEYRQSKLKKPYMNVRRVIACGEDSIFYEYVIYGGHYVVEALANLYSAMCS